MTFVLRHERHTVLWSCKKVIVAWSVSHAAKASSSSCCTADGETSRPGFVYLMIIWVVVKWSSSSSPYWQQHQHHHHCRQHYPSFSSPVAASLFFLPLVLQVKQALAGTSTSSRRTSRRETERRRAGIWRGKRWKSRKWKEYFKKGERVTFNFSRLVWQHSWTSWTFLYKSCWVTCQKWHKFDRKYLRRFLSHLHCHHQQLLVLWPQKGIWHSYRTSLYT